jgi:hypothetical protein
MATNLHLLPRWLVQVPPQKSERPPFRNTCNYEIKNDSVEVTFSGMTSLLNVIKACQFVEKLLAEDTQTDRQHGDLISHTFPSYESGEKMRISCHCCLFTYENPGLRPRMRRACYCPHTRRKSLLGMRYTRMRKISQQVTELLLAIMKAFIPQPLNKQPTIGLHVFWWIQCDSL